MAALVALAPALQGCLPLVAAGAVGGGALMAEDRRSGGTYLDDEAIENKTLARILALPGQGLHVNVTSFNRHVLLTGEVPDEARRAELGRLARGVAGVRTVLDELVVAPVSTVSSRATDTLITSRVKARFIEARRFQANHVKVVTENRTVFLMGIVTAAEAQRAADIAARTPEVRRVVSAFEVVGTARPPAAAPAPRPERPGSTRAAPVPPVA